MCKKGEIAACILYITNGISMVLALAGLGIGIWLVVADTGVTNSFPDYLSIVIVIAMALITLLAGLGVFATVAQMKENKDNDPNTGKALGQEGCGTKDCCNSCGLSLYCFFAIIGSVFALALGIVALYYSGALPTEVTGYYDNTTASATVDNWFIALDNYIDTQINTAIVESTSDGGTDWISTQDLLGCCGWNSTTADPSVYQTGACCTSDGGDAVLIDSLSGDVIEDLFAGNIEVTLSECNEYNGAVMTCKGVMLYITQSNMTTIGIVLLVIALVLLICFICALKVRYCSGGQGDQAAVTPAPGKGEKNAKVNLNDVEKQKS